jgi:predicted nucleic acid-binding protein
VAEIYLETTFISACVTTRTTLRARYEREVSIQWLHLEEAKHTLYVSDAVIAELSAVTYPRRTQALELAGRFESLATTVAMEEFAQVLARRQVMPRDLRGDALHVASAAVAKMDYLLTWNVAHLANKSKVNHLRAVCIRHHLIPPEICRPDDFLVELRV